MQFAKMRIEAGYVTKRKKQKMEGLAKCEQKGEVTKNCFQTKTTSVDKEGKYENVDAVKVLQN